MNKADLTEKLAQKAGIPKVRAASNFRDERVYTSPTEVAVLNPSCPTRSATG